MRVSNATLLGVIGLAAAAVLVATAGGLFTDAPPAVEHAGVVVLPRAPLDPPPLQPAPTAATRPAAAPQPGPAQAAAPEPPVQGEWRVPDQPELKAVRPPPDASDLPRQSPVYAPGEQQAAWAARDQLANAGRAARPAPPAALTRAYEGAAPDKQAATR